MSSDSVVGHVDNVIFKQRPRKMSIAIERMPSPEEEPIPPQPQPEEPKSPRQTEQIQKEQQQTSSSPLQARQAKQQPRKFLGAREGDLPLVSKSVRS